MTPLLLLASSNQCTLLLARARSWPAARRHTRCWPAVRLRPPPLARNKDQLARSLTQKLIIYATGADIQFADREVIEQIVATLSTQNYGLRTLVHEIVQSRVFLNK